MIGGIVRTSWEWKGQKWKRQEQVVEEEQVELARICDSSNDRWER